MSVGSEGCWWRVRGVGWEWGVSWGMKMSVGNEVYHSRMRDVGDLPQFVQEEVGVHCLYVIF